jgi:hypothetical protein
MAIAKRNVLVRRRAIRACATLEHNFLITIGLASGEVSSMFKTALLFLSITTFSSFSLPMFAQVVGPGRPRVEPCWQRAGISRSVIQERDAIQRQTRVQVEAVCANNALSAQQKQQRIREIREQTRAQIDTLITPQQQEALRACQHERAAAHPPAPSLHRGGVGPCGELTTAPAHPTPPAGHPDTSKPPVEDETPPQR